MIGEETAAYIMSGLIGVPYPEGDPEVCRAAARYWRKVGGLMTDFERTTERSTGVIEEARQSGAAITSFYDLVDDVLPRLDRLRLASEQLAEALEKFADKLQEAQREFNYLAWRVAVDIGVTVAFGILTVGLSSAVTTLYLSRVFIRAAAIFGAYQRAAVVFGATVTYYTLDSLAYTAVDVGALKVVDWVYGEKGSTWGDAGRTFAANVAFDAAFDAQAKAVGATFGTVAASNIWTRAAMRFIASSVAYTPTDNMLAGRAISEWLPTQDQVEQKAVIHAMGRVMFTEPFRDTWSSYGKAWTRSLFGLK